MEKKRLIIQDIMFLQLLVITAFLAYGAIRGAYVDQVLDRQSDERTSVVYKVLNQGKWYTRSIRNNEKVWT